MEHLKVIFNTNHDLKNNSRVVVTVYDDLNKRVVARLSADDHDDWQNKLDSLIAWLEGVGATYAEMSAAPSDDPPFAG